MNPMTNVKNIKKLSEGELKGRNKTSWHEQYRGSAWIFVGGLPYDLTEGDIICVFSQYGEPLNLNLVRDKETGKSKGFCFICYEDQRSTDLAVDNLNGIKILGRTLRVDHVEKYKPPKDNKDEQLEATSKTQREKVNQENDVVGEADKNVKEYGPKRKNEEKYRRGNDYAPKGSHKKEKMRKLKGKRKKRDEHSDVQLPSGRRKKIKHARKSPASESSLSNSSLSPSSSSSTSSSPSSTSSSSSSSSSPSSSSSSSSSSSTSSSSNDEADEVDKKSKRSMRDKNLKQKKSRTIEDLKREARLIQAELKRRQKIDEQKIKSRRTSKEKQQSRRDDRKSRFRSVEEDNRCETSKDQHRNAERRHQRTGHRKDHKNDRSNSPPRRRSRSPKILPENGHRHLHR